MGRELPADHPGEDDVGGPPEDLRHDHAHHHAGHPERDDQDEREPVRAQPADEPPGRRSEGHRLLRRHAHTHPRWTAGGSSRGGQPARDRTLSRPGPSRGRGGGRGRSSGRGLFSAVVLRVCLALEVRAHAAASTPSCESTISAYGRQDSRSSSWRPMPTTSPSSSTTIWSASTMVDTRWATMSTAASRVIGRRAARSRASVPRSSAENESSNR